MRKYRETKGLYTNVEAGVTVCEGVLTDSNTPIAVKKQTVTTVEQANACIHEAMVQMSLHHPNICKAYDCFLHQSDHSVTCILLLELLDHDLYTDIRLREQKKLYYEEADILEILSGLVSALRYAQEKGVCHRDIKPQNVFLSDQTPKLGDFGSSLFLPTPCQPVTSLSGTPLYLSPELHRLHSLFFLSDPLQTSYDPFKSDVYSLGMTLLHMALLRPPLELIPYTENTPEIIKNMVVSLTIYPRLQRILPKMMCFYPENRVSFREIEEELRGFRVEDFEVLQESMAIGGMMGGRTIRPCGMCKGPINSSEWTRYIPPDLLKYSDYFSDICSLQCLLRFQAQFDPQNTRISCVWCDFSGKMTPNVTIILPCGHFFHNKYCLFTFFACFSDNFHSISLYKCPKCGNQVTFEYIEDQIGRDLCTEAMFLYTKDLCLVCGEEIAQFYCKNDNVRFCSKCNVTIWLIFPSCPHCHSLRIAHLPLSTRDSDIKRLLA